MTHNGDKAWRLHICHLYVLFLQNNYNEPFIQSIHLFADYVHLGYNGWTDLCTLMELFSFCATQNRAKSCHPDAGHNEKLVGFTERLH
jgi:hypothetical protein